MHFVPLLIITIVFYTIVRLYYCILYSLFFSQGENNTAIESTATVFKKVVLPMYMFIAGVLVGVVILAMALIWRSVAQALKQLQT